MTLTFESFNLQTKQVNKLKENMSVITEEAFYGGPQFFHT